MGRPEIEGPTAAAVKSLVRTLATNTQFPFGERKQAVVAALGAGIVDPHLVRNEFLNTSRALKDRMSPLSPLFVGSLIDTGATLLDFMPPRWTTIVSISETLQPIVAEVAQPTDVLTVQLQALQEAAIQNAVRQEVPTATLGDETFPQDLTTAFLKATQQNLKHVEVFVLLQAGQIIAPYLPHTDGKVTVSIANELITVFTSLMTDVSYDLDFDKRKMGPYLGAFDSLKVALGVKPTPAPKPPPPVPVMREIITPPVAPTIIERRPTQTRPRRTTGKTTRRETEKPTIRQIRAKRLAEIPDLIKEQGMTIQQLMDHFGIAKAQIFKDLAELERRGLLQRPDKQISRPDAHARHTAILQYLADHGYDFETNPTVLTEAETEFNVSKEIIYYALRTAALKGSLPNTIRVRPSIEADVARREKLRAKMMVLFGEDRIQQKKTLHFIERGFKAEKPNPEDLRSVFVEILQEQPEGISPTRIEKLIAAAHVLIPYLPFNQTTFREVTHAFRPLIDNTSDTPDGSRITETFNVLQETLIEAIVADFQNNVPLKRTASRKASVYEHRAYILRAMLHDVSSDEIAERLQMHVRSVDSHIQEMQYTGYLEGRNSRVRANIAKYNEAQEIKQAKIEQNRAELQRILDDPSVVLAPLHRKIIELIIEGRDRPYIEANSGVKSASYLRRVLTKLRERGIPIEKLPSPHSKK